MKKLALLLPLLLAGCIVVSKDVGDNMENTANSEIKSVRVGVSQYASHPVIDDIRQGIIDGFAAAGYKEGINISFDFQNAQGESAINQAIAQKFFSGNSDLLMPLGTPVSQAIVNLVKDRPVVFGAVTDPLSAGLVKSLEQPGANVTGTSDITLYKEQLELLRQIVPEAKTVGVVYTSSEANARYALEQAEKYAKELGLQIKTAAISNGAEIMTAAQSLASSVDAFYMLPDNTLIAGQEALIKVTLDVRKPLIAIDQSGVEKGALATLGTNYRKVGERTAEIAVRVLNGEAPGTIPVLGVTDADLFINEKTAQAISITFPEGMKAQAKHVY